MGVADPTRLMGPPGSAAAPVRGTLGGASLPPAPPARGAALSTTTATESFRTSPTGSVIVATVFGIS